MIQSDNRETPPSVQDVARIVGGGPGISSSCARLFAENGMRAGVAARNPEKPVPEALEKAHGVRRYACDASEPAAVKQLFENVVRDIGKPRLVIHNIDGRVPGIFRKSVVEADPGMAFETFRNAAFSTFLVGQQAARLMLGNELDANGAKGTIIFTNANSERGCERLRHAIAGGAIKPPAACTSSTTRRQPSSSVPSCTS